VDINKAVPWQTYVDEGLISLHRPVGDEKMELLLAKMDEMALNQQSFKESLVRQDKTLKDCFAKQDRSLKDRFDEQDKSLQDRFEAQEQSMKDRFDNQDQSIQRQFADQDTYLITNNNEQMTELKQIQSQDQSKFEAKVAEQIKETLKLSETALRDTVGPLHARFDEIEGRLAENTGGVHARIDDMEDRFKQSMDRADAKIEAGIQQVKPTIPFPFPPPPIVPQIFTQTHVSPPSQTVKSTTAPGQSTGTDNHFGEFNPPKREPDQVGTQEVFNGHLNRRFADTTRDNRYVYNRGRDFDRDRQRDQSPSPDRPQRVHRSKSPQGPRMATFSGEPSGVKFDVFLAKFNRVANRRQWDDAKKLDRFFDCLTDQALEYANRSTDKDQFDRLVQDMTVRFDYRDEPLAARQKLSAVKQDQETEEEFLQKIQALANDAYRDEGNNEILNRLTTEAFLRGLRNKEAALDALGRKPVSMQDALKHVKAFCANSKVLGVTPTKQVTFEQNTVSVTPETALKDLGDSLLRGMESLFKTHLDPRSRSPSPFQAQRERFPSPQDRYRGRDLSPYRNHREFERGRPVQRYNQSDRDPRNAYRRSPDRSRFERPYSPRSYLPRGYSPSPRRDGYGPRDNRGWERREDKYRGDEQGYREPSRPYQQEPRRPYQQEPQRPYQQEPSRPYQHESPRSYQQDPNRPYWQDRGIGQNRRDYQVRSTSPLPNDENSKDLNLDGLVATATHN